MSATFRQKSAGISLVLIGAVAGYYIVRVVGMVRAGASLGAESPIPNDFPWLVLGVLVIFVVAEVGLQAALALGAGKIPAATDRDRAAALWAQRNAYLPLLIGVLLTCVSLPLRPSLLAVGNLLLLSLVASEVTRLISQLLHGHTGARRRATVQPIAVSQRREVTEMAG